MAKKLREIKLKEISIVNAPANRQSFIFIKNEDKCPNCKGTLKQINKIDEESSCIQFSCLRCKKVFEQIVTKENLMNDEIKKLYKELTDEEIGENEISILEAMADEDIEIIKNSLVTLNKYKKDEALPEDLHSAISAITKYATGKAVKPVSKDTDAQELLKKQIEDLEKSGKKLSKDTAEKIKKAVGTLKDTMEKFGNILETLSSLIPDDGNSADTDKKVKKDDKIVEKTIVEKFDDSAINASLAEIKKSFETLNDTITEKDTVMKELSEKVTGFGKTIAGGDNLNDEIEKDENNKDTKWPSFAKRS